MSQLVTPEMKVEHNTLDWITHTSIVCHLLDLTCTSGYCFLKSYPITRSAPNLNHALLLTPCQHKNADISNSNARTPECPNGHHSATVMWAPSELFIETSAGLSMIRGATNGRTKVVSPPPRKNPAHRVSIDLPARMEDRC